MSAASHHLDTQFDQAMQFLYEKHGNSISEDLVEVYCRSGLLREEGGKLTLTDRGRAQLRQSRRRATN